MEYFKLFLLGVVNEAFVGKNSLSLELVAQLGTSLKIDWDIRSSYLYFFEIPKKKLLSCSLLLISCTSNHKIKQIFIASKVFLRGSKFENSADAYLSEEAQRQAKQQKACRYLTAPYRTSVTYTMYVLCMCVYMMSCLQRECGLRITFLTFCVAMLLPPSPLHIRKQFQNN